MFVIEMADMPSGGGCSCVVFKSDYVEASVGSRWASEANVPVVHVRLYDYGIEISGGSKLHKAVIKVTMHYVMAEFVAKPDVFLDYITAIKNDAHILGIKNARHAMLAALGIERYE